MTGRNKFQQNGIILKPLEHEEVTKNVFDGIYSFSHRRIPMINPYIARASANATTKKLLKNVSGFSVAALIAAEPEADIAIPDPRQAKLTARPAAKAINDLFPSF